MKVSINGALTEANAARIDPSDRGLTLGDGLFETIAIRKGAPRRLPAHLARLRGGATVLAIPLAQSDDQIAALIQDVLKANNLTDGSVRVTLTRGPGARGVAPPAQPSPTFLITAAAATGPMEPARVIIAKTTRRNEHSPLSRIKSLNYLDNVLGRLEASEADADDALLLNTAGRVAESTVANVFILVGGGLFTPPIEDGALPGVMRMETIKLTRADEMPVTVEMLNRASEIFLTNALGLRPVISVDGNPVGDGEPGLITQLLAARL